MEKNVLVVDDEAMIRESVAAYLTRQGCQVFTAEDGHGSAFTVTLPKG